MNTLWTRCWVCFISVYTRLMVWVVEYCKPGTTNTIPGDLVCTFDVYITVCRRKIWFYVSKLYKLCQKLCVWIITMVKVTEKIVLRSSWRIGEYHNVVRQLLNYSWRTIFTVTKSRLVNKHTEIQVIQKIVLRSPSTCRRVPQCQSTCFTTPWATIFESQGSDTQYITYLILWRGLLDNVCAGFKRMK